MSGVEDEIVSLTVSQGLETAKPRLAALTTNAASASSPVRLVLGTFPAIR